MPYKIKVLNTGQFVYKDLKNYSFTSEVNATMWPDRQLADAVANKLRMFYKTTDTQFETIKV